MIHQGFAEESQERQHSEIIVFERAWGRLKHPKETITVVSALGRYMVAFQSSWSTMVIINRAMEINIVFNMLISADFKSHRAVG